MAVAPLSSCRGPEVVQHAAAIEKAREFPLAASASPTTWPQASTSVAALASPPKSPRSVMTPPP